MNIKKFFLVVLSLAMMLTSVLVPVAAQGSTQSNAFSSTVAPFVGYSQAVAESERIDLSNIPTLKGVSSATQSAYKIDSVEAYSNFVSLVNSKNSFEGKTVYLACDLDLSSLMDLAPIGHRTGTEVPSGNSTTFQETSCAQFKGSFDGQGYELFGISVQKDLSYSCYSALFGWVSGATIKNLKAEGTVTHEKGTYPNNHTNYVGTGGLVACADGKTVISNVYCDIDVYGLRQTGGIVGRGGDVTVTNVTNMGDARGESCAGGIGGFVASMTVLNSVNAGYISSSSIAGGIHARARGVCNINGCINDGTVESLNKDRAGGIIGTVENSGGVANLVSCTNYGMIISVSNKVNSFGHAVSSGVLNVDSSCADQTRSGYSTDRITKVDLTSVKDIASVSAVNETAYKITTPEGMIRFSELVKAGNTFSNVTVYLDQNISLMGKDFEPIGYVLSGESGTVKKPFSGTFDGQGHIISDLVIVQNDNVRSGLGLFGYAENAVIKNLVLAPSCSFTLNIVDSYNGVGAVIGSSGVSVTVSNVITYATVIGQTHSAGIMARGNGDVYFCTNYGYISGSNCAGGISAFRTGIVQDCVNYGVINGGIAGGVVSRAYGNHTYKNLVNYGMVSGTTYSGGVIGRINAGTVTLQNCRNYATVQGGVSDGLYTVAAGATPKVTVNNCTTMTAVGYSVSNMTPTYNTGKSISKYQAYPNEFSYSVFNAQDLLKLSSLVQQGIDFAGVTVYLMNDIDMDGVAFLPIGYGEHAFCGTFDGRGYAVSNLRVSIDSSVSASAESAALFGLTAGAIIRNIVLDKGCSVAQTKVDSAKTGAAAGILANSIKTTHVINAWNCADVSSALYAGGIAGKGEIVLISCTNSGDVVAEIGGGIVASGVSSVNASVNYGTVKGECVGGIIGCQELDSAVYAACYHYGVTFGSAYAGGLIGAVRANCRLLACTSFGSVGSLAGYDAVTTSLYQVERGYQANVTAFETESGTAIGYSSALIDQTANLNALLANGLAKNIEDYDHSKDSGAVLYLLIDSVEDMALFSKLINTTTNGEGMTFCLVANVDMNIYTFNGDYTSTASNYFAPIGGSSANVSAAKYFAGTFDGMGHTISNLHLSASGNSEAMIGLFGKLSGATVKNLIIDESCSFGENGNANTAVASLAPVIENSTVQNVWTRASVASEGSYIGGMACIANNSIFVNCTSDATVVANGTYAGGFVGTGKGTCYYNCRNLSTISGFASAAGGFAGMDDGDCIYSNCINMGCITNASVTGALAGVKASQNASKHVGAYHYGAAASGALVGRVDAGSFAPMQNTSVGKEIDDYHFKQLLDVKYQIRDNGDGTFDLRLISTVDSLNYQHAGFRFVYSNTAAGYSVDIDGHVNTVYTSILSEGKIVTPSDVFTDASRYFILYTVENIPDACKSELMSEMDTAATAYLRTSGGKYINHAYVNPIVVPEKLTPTIETNVGVINRFDVPNIYEIGNTGVTVNLQYHAWPSVTVDENGVLYALASARLEHVDPFGHTLMYKSYDGGKTWSQPILVTDTPMDDRDVGVTYMGNGKMLITYFRIACASLLKTDQSFTTADGKLIKGDGTYTTWQNHKNIEQKHIDAVLEYWRTLHSSEISAQSWSRISEDYGATWSEPMLTPISTPHGPILLRNGNLLYVGRGSVAGVGGDGIYAFISTDGGYNWQFKGKIHENTYLTFCEPHVVELSNGRLLVGIRVQPTEKVKIGDVTYRSLGFEDATGSAIFKIDGEETATAKTYRFETQSDGTPKAVRYDYTGTLTGYRIHTSYSDDGGTTWTRSKVVTDKYGKELYGTPPQLIQLDNGAVVMTYASRKVTDSGEYAIVSYDGGMTWDEEICLCLRKGGTSDIGYPSTVHLGDGKLVTVYYQAYENDSYCSFLYTRWFLK